MGTCKLLGKPNTLRGSDLQWTCIPSRGNRNTYMYSWQLHATETGISSSSSGPVGSKASPFFLCYVCDFIISNSVQNNKDHDKCHPVIIVCTPVRPSVRMYISRCSGKWNEEFITIDMFMCIAFYQSYIHGSSQAQFVAETHIVIVLSILLLQSRILKCYWWNSLYPFFTFSYTIGLSQMSCQISI